MGILRFVCRVYSESSIEIREIEISMDFVLIYKQIIRVNTFFSKDYMGEIFGFKIFKTYFKSQILGVFFFVFFVAID